MRTVGNVFWFVFVGLWLGLGMFISGIIYCLTIVGIPLGIACFRIARVAFTPFGKTITTNYASHPVGNVICMVFGGAYMAVSFAIMGAIFCVTIIGIPFGIQCFKLMRISALPFGAEIEKA